MALKWGDRVLETSTSTGTGAMSLAAAVTGYQRFSAVCSNADTCYYAIFSVDANGNPSGDWETGLGTYSGTNTLTRTAPSASTNGGAAVNFGAGTKYVMLTPTAAHYSSLGTGGGSGTSIDQGVHTIPILAGAMIPRTTNGAAINVSETGTNKVMTRTLDFDQSTDEFVQIILPMPKSWDEGTVTVQFIWTASATGNVVWGAQGVAISDDDPLDGAFGTAQTVTDGVTATGDVMESAFTSAITIGGTPAAEDMVVLQFYRDADNGSDTLAADAKLIAVRVKYTISAADDA